MALPSSGQISLQQVNVELGRASTAQISLNETAVRNLFGVASGGIGMAHGYGKSASFVKTLTITANTQNYNIRSAAIAAGWDEVTPANVTVVINAGVYVGASSTANFGITTGSFPAGSVITIVNNGYIVGCGGAGGQGGSKYGSGGAGGAGGSAISMNYPVTIQNNGSIFGGGGGGGGGGAAYNDGGALDGGGGGGGGAGYNGGGGGGGGGSHNGSATGRAGGAGSTAGPGAGGRSNGYGTNGGNGGTWGAAGGAGASGGLGTGGGGAAGSAIRKNGFALTWGGTNGASTTYVKGAVV